jgi:transcriptional regulator GlxA family with amidase domain
VVLVIFPGFQGLDLIGPVEVLAAANDELGEPVYRLQVAGVPGGPVATHSGITMAAEWNLSEIRSDVDTLLVVGGEGTYLAVADDALVDGVARVASRARRITSVCSGAFLLAQAGLLDGHRATTHWRVCDLLAERFPNVEVDPDPIYVRSGNVWTSAGVTAGMDLALALVEEDHGPEVSLAIARRLVMFLRRPAGQSQFSAVLRAQAAEHNGIRTAQHHVLEHPEADCSVAALAQLALMSQRTFARTFAEQVGVTPARFVERVRTEHARRLLETTDDGVEAVASAAGFGTAETMRRTFLRALRTNPTDYRRRFRAA